MAGVTIMISTNESTVSRWIWTIERSSLCLNVRDEVLEDEVGVEADGGHEVNDVDGGLEKITFVWTAEKSKLSKRCVLVSMYTSVNYYLTNI